MWLDNLKELKKATGMSSKQIAEKTNLPERTVVRIFSGDTDNPYVDTLHRIVTALGGSLDDILADTKVVVAAESLVEVKENASAVEAENESLKATITAQAIEIELLKKEIAHQEELLAHRTELLELHRYYKAHIEKLVEKIY